MQDPLTEFLRQLDRLYYDLQSNFQYVDRKLDPHGADWWPEPLTLPDGVVGGCCASWVDALIDRALALAVPNDVLMCRTKLWCEPGSDQAQPGGRGYHAILTVVVGSAETPASWGLERAYDLRQTMPCTPQELVSGRGYSCQWLLNPGPVNRQWQEFDFS